MFFLFSTGKTKHASKSFKHTSCALLEACKSVSREFPYAFRWEERGAKAPACFEKRARTVRFQKGAMPRLSFTPAPRRFNSASCLKAACYELHRVVTFRRLPIFTSRTRRRARCWEERLAHPDRRPGDWTSSGAVSSAASSPLTCSRTHSCALAPPPCPSSRETRAIRPVGRGFGRGLTTRLGRPASNNSAPGLGLAPLAPPPAPLAQPGLQRLRLVPPINSSSPPN